MGEKIVNDETMQVVSDLHAALEEDVRYYAPMGQRGPVIHSIVDYEPIIVPVEFDHDELGIISDDDWGLHSLDEMCEWAISSLDANDEDLVAFCERIENASGSFSWSGNNEDGVLFDWDGGANIDRVLPAYDYSRVVDVLRDAFPCDELTVVGVRYVPVVDRGAQFLTHAEAKAWLQNGNYSPRAHTYCCHIPDGSLLARLLEAVGPVHH